ncbi:MAG TPA: DUF2071 domain-containing protein [Candidatus Binatia bacterium]|jgi:hypothetical protein
MRLPVIKGVIKRRILVNFRVDPEVMRAQLPSRFTPKLQGNYAIAGVCLIRLEAIRPRMLPSFIGISSENAAHRVAVRWENSASEKKEGVFIPRRDTGSLMNYFGGGRIFPGEHNRAIFDVREDDKKIDFRMRSLDGTVAVRLAARLGGNFSTTSCFQLHPVFRLWKQRRAFSSPARSAIRSPASREGWTASNCGRRVGALSRCKSMKSSRVISLMRATFRRGALNSIAP